MKHTLRDFRGIIISGTSVLIEHKLGNKRPNRRTEHTLLLPRRVQKSIGESQLSPVVSRTAELAAALGSCGTNEVKA